jgi:DNA-binding response OmpR family regulator
VGVAATLADAKSMATSREYDTILCDVGLPDGYGTELPAIVKPLCPQTKLIALTARGSPEEISAIRASGFDAHIQKPAEIETLQKHLA